MKIAVETCEIKTATIDVKVMRLDKRQLTLSIFRQLEEDFIFSTTGLRGKLWGKVNYTWAGCHPETAFHVVWQAGDRLVRGPVPKSKLSLMHYGDLDNEAGLYDWVKDDDSLFDDGFWKGVDTDGEALSQCLLHENWGMMERARIPGSSRILPGRMLTALKRVDAVHDHTVVQDWKELVEEAVQLCNAAHAIKQTYRKCIDGQYRTVHEVDQLFIAG